jgi:hypothetical protein
LIWDDDATFLLFDHFAMEISFLLTLTFVVQESTRKFPDLCASDEASNILTIPASIFCHAWIKSKLGLRQFHVRGLGKVQMELLWACLTYNLQHWIRLRKLKATAS